MKKLFAALVFAGVLALMPAARADVIVIFELLDATDGCAPGSLGCEGAGVGGYFTFDETTDQVIRWDVYTPDYNFSPTDSEVVAYIGSLGNDVINWSNGPTSSIYYEELGFGFPTPLGVVSDPAGGRVTLTRTIANRFTTRRQYRSQCRCRNPGRSFFLAAPSSGSARSGAAVVSDSGVPKQTAHRASDRGFGARRAMACSKNKKK